MGGVRVFFLALVLLGPAWVGAETPPVPWESARSRIIESNEEAFAQRWELLQQVHSKVRLAYFIIQPDDYGLALLGQLLILARKGVEVDLMLDARGSNRLIYFHSRYLKALAANGVRVTVYNPFSLLRPLDVFGADHDKIALFDSRISMLGGRNLAAADFGTHPDANRDYDVVTESERLAAYLDRAFDWERKLEVNRVIVNDLAPEKCRKTERELIGRALRTSYSLLRHPVRQVPFTSGTHWVETRVLDSDSWVEQQEFNEIKAEWLARIEGAQKEILIHNAYIALSDDLVEALARAGKRGVQVILHTNSRKSSMGHRIPQMLFQAEWRYLKSRIPGLEIFTASFDQRHIHSKVAVIDGEYCVLGSYNLDQLSEKVNSEVALVLRSSDMAKRLRFQILRQILQHGEPIEVEEKRVRFSNCRRFLEQGAAIVLGLLRPFI